MVPKHHLIYYSTVFHRKSDSALSSLCYGADFRWTSLPLNSWASIKRRMRGGGGGGGGGLIKEGHLLEEIWYQTSFAHATNKTEINRDHFLGESDVPKIQDD